MPTKQPAKPKKRVSPIADVFEVMDIGETEINHIIDAARAFPMLRAYGDPDGRWIAIATEQPTKAQFKKFLGL